MATITLNSRSRVRFDWTNGFKDRWTPAPIAPERGELLTLHGLRDRYAEISHRNQTNEWVSAIAVKVNGKWHRSTTHPREIIAEMNMSEAMRDYDRQNGLPVRPVSITVAV